MKNILICVLLANITGCSSGVAWGENRTSRATPEMLDPVIYKDRATGCEYLSKWGGESSLTPRVSENGVSHMGCKESK